MAWEINLHTKEVKERIDAVIFEAQKETFEQDILTEAQNRSPVRTGTNVASLQVETVDTPAGPDSRIFSTSGYGGFLEVGTKKMAAEPYIYPAFLHGIINFPMRVYRKLNG